MVCDLPGVSLPPARTHGDAGAGRGDQVARLGRDRCLRWTLMRAYFSLFQPYFRSDSTMPATIDRDQMEQEALGRAVGNQSTMNYGAIFQGFMEKGIPESDILPRENV